MNAISSEIAARIEAARKANQIENEKKGESQIDNNATDNENPGGTEPTDPGTTDPTDPGTTDPTDPGTTDPTDPGMTDPSDPGTDTPGTEPTDPGTDNPPATVDTGGGGTSQDTRSGEEAA